MARILAVVVILSIICAPVAAAEQSSYQRYSHEEFDPWMHDLRRAETLFFGSLPISFAASSLSMVFIQDDYRSVQLQLGITLGISAAIAIADYILGLLEEDAIDE
jgi:hypothetical protein